MGLHTFYLSIKPIVVFQFENLILRVDVFQLLAKSLLPPLVVSSAVGIFLLHDYHSQIH